MARRLLPASSGVVAVNGFHLYHRRFLDVALFSRDKYAAVIEVKRGLKEGDVEKALDQVLYYTYAVSRGLGIRPARLFSILAAYGGPLDVNEDGVELALDALTERYGLRRDHTIIAAVRPGCRGGRPDALLEALL